MLVLTTRTKLEFPSEQSMGCEALCVSLEQVPLPQFFVSQTMAATSRNRKAQAHGSTQFVAARCGKRRNIILQTDHLSDLNTKRLNQGKKGTLVRSSEDPVEKGGEEEVYKAVCNKSLLRRTSSCVDDAFG